MRDMQKCNYTKLTNFLFYELPDYYVPIEWRVGVVTRVLLMSDNIVHITI